MNLSNVVVFINFTDITKVSFAVVLHSQGQIYCWKYRANILFVESVHDYEWHLNDLHTLLELHTESDYLYIICI